VLPSNVREALHLANDRAKRAAFEALHKANGQVRLMLQVNKATVAMGFPQGVLERYTDKILPLDIGEGLTRPTWMRAADEALYVNLSFSGRECECVIPWRVVGGMYSDPDGDAFAWSAVTRDAVPKAVAPARGGLRLVKGGVA
jgi:hypothetical protein